MSDSTPFTRYLDDGDRIASRPMLWVQIGAALVAWMLVGAFLFFLCIIGASVVKFGWPGLAPASIFLLWLAICGGVAMLVFTGMCAAVCSLSIDVASRSYQFVCGVFPLRLRRSGDLGDFEQVGRFVKRQNSIYTGAAGGLESALCLSWHQPRWPYWRSLNTITLTMIADAGEAERYGKALAARLALPYAEVVNNQLSRNRQPNLPPEIRQKP